MGTAWRPFSSSVDWYNPPPDGGPLPPNAEAVPQELIVPVHGPRRAEATLLLGRANVIAFEPTHAREIAEPIDPDTVLHALIAEIETKLRIFRSNPAPGDAELVEKLQRRISRYRAWHQRLTPHLIKAVSLNSHGSGFHGTLVEDTLFLDQIAAVRRPVPMLKMPIIAFLPRKPNKVYTTFTTFQ